MSRAEVLLAGLAAPRMPEGSRLISAGGVQDESSNGGY